MDGADAVTDPTDWANTAVASLQPVESALRCQVCKEFFETPVITSCAHTFCSLCIRRCLSHDGKCPTCRAEDQPIRLRRNWVVEEIVSSFTRARPDILEMGKEVLTFRRGNTPFLKRKLEDVSSAEGDEGPNTRRRTRNQTRLARQSPSPSIYEISDDEAGHVKNQVEVNDGKVECPICRRRMKEQDVSPHMDKEHFGPSSAPPAAQPAVFGLQRKDRDGRSTSHTPGTKAVEPLSALSYGIMNDGALRKKLQALGIPTYGSKQFMIQRHKEWVSLWNANCDSSKPRSKRELLSDLDSWERTQGSQARTNTDVNGIMSKDFDGKGWAKSNDKGFQDLIVQARAKRIAPVKEPPMSQASNNEASADETVPTRSLTMGALTPVQQPTSPPMVSIISTQDKEPTSASENLKPEAVNAVDAAQSHMHIEKDSSAQVNGAHDAVVS